MACSCLVLHPSRTLFASLADASIGQPQDFRDLVLDGVVVLLMSRQAPALMV